MGAILLFASLVFVGLQIKQNSGTTRAQTHQQLASDRAYTIRMMIENQELRDATRKAASGEILTENERGILVWYTILHLRAYENELYQHSIGMIDNEELEVQRSILEAPHMQIETLSAMSLQAFTPAVQAEIHKLVEVRRGAT